METTLRRAYRCRSAPRLLMALSAALAVTSCGRAPAPPRYDPLHGQLMNEAIKALSAGDNSLAERELQRLCELLPESDAAAFLLREARDRGVRKQAAARAGKAQFDAALNQLREASRRYGESRLVRSEIRRVEALIALRRYLECAAFADAEQMRQALAVLPRADVFGDAGDAYAAWLAKQRVAAADLARRERQRLVLEDILACDAALLTDPARADLLLAQLATLVPDHPYYVAAFAAGAAAAPTDRDARELFAYRQLNAPGETMAAPGKAAAVSPPGSFVGAAAVTRVSFAEHRWAAGVLTYRLLAGGLPKVRAPDLGNAFWHAKRGVGTPPSLSVTGVLDLLYF